MSGEVRMCEAQRREALATIPEAMATRIRPGAVVRVCAAVMEGGAVGCCETLIEEFPAENIHLR